MYKTASEIAETVLLKLSYQEEASSIPLDSEAPEPPRLSMAERLNKIKSEGLTGTQAGAGIGALVGGLGGIPFGPPGMAIGALGVGGAGAAMSKLLASGKARGAEGMANIRQRVEERPRFTADEGEYDV